MHTLLTLVLLIAVGFVGSHGMARRATRSRPLAGLFATGAEFLAGGMLLGPDALGLVPREVLADLEPIVCLALGWAGMLLGIDLVWGDLARVPRRVHRALAGGAAASIIGVGVAALAAAPHLGTGSAPRARAALAVVLGVTAAISSPTIVAVAVHRLRARGPVTHLLRLAGGLGSVYPMLAFGLLSMFVHPRVASVGDAGSALVGWILVTAAALVLGGLMVVFAHERVSDDEMLLVITGTVLMAGGLAYAFDVSALYIAMGMGFVVANASRRRHQVFRDLVRVEKPLFVALCVYVGAVLGPPGRLALAGAAGYVVVRVALRLGVAGMLLSRALEGTRPAPWRVGQGLVGQGIFAVAIALDYALANPGTASRVALAVVTLAVMADDAVGYVLVTAGLRAVGEAAPTPSDDSDAGGGL